MNIFSQIVHWLTPLLTHAHWFIFSINQTIMLTCLFLLTCSPLCLLTHSLASKLLCSLICSFISWLLKHAHWLIFFINHSLICFCSWVEDLSILEWTICPILRWKICLFLGGNCLYSLCWICPFLGGRSVCSWVEVLSNP